MSSNTVANPTSRLAGSKRTKRYHHKVRSGCQTCRDRHLKCDEIKPICGRCQRLRLSCIFDRQDSNKQEPKASHNQIIISRPGSNQAGSLSYGSTNLNVLQCQPEETRFFQYYLSCTMSRFSASPEQLAHDNIGMVFSVLAPQVAQTSQVVRHAISAAASAEENLMRHSNTSQWLRHRQQHHFGATLRALLGSDINIEELLICCVLLFSYSCLSRDFKAANLHLQSGLRLIEERKQVSSVPLLFTVERALKDLEPSLALILDGSQRYNFIVLEPKPINTVKPFENEQEAHLVLRTIITDLANDNTANLDDEYMAWQTRIEASQIDLEGVHAKLTMHLYNALLFVFVLISSPRDAVVTNTCQFAINDQLEYILSQNQPCMQGDVTTLQEVVGRVMKDRTSDGPLIEKSYPEIVQLPVTQTHVRSFLDSWTSGRRLH